MSRTYTLTMEVEIKMTSKGYPATGPSYSSGGEPAEPPEFEIESITINGNKKSVEELYAEYKTTRPEQLSTPTSYDQFFADAFYDAALNKAYDDDWSDDIYGDSPEPDFDR